MYFAGTPPTTVFSATSFVTTAPAAIMDPSPMETPERIVAFDPIQTSFPILIGEGIRLPLLEGFSSWFRVAKTTLCPINTLSPM